MKIATLGIVLQNGNLLLGEKMKGEIGIGRLSGPGGKLDPGETLEECLLRETREELEIELDSTSLDLVAIIDFFAGPEVDFRVYIYRALVLTGELHETKEMLPAWYPIENLPYDKMYDADRHWIARAISGDRFRAKVYYRNRARDFDRIEFLPFD